MGRQNALELASRVASLMINYTSSAAAAEAVVKDIECLGSRTAVIKAEVSKISRDRSPIRPRDLVFRVSRLSVISARLLRKCSIVFSVSIRGDDYSSRSRLIIFGTGRQVGHAK